MSANISTPSGVDPGGTPRSGLSTRETRRFTARLTHVATPMQRTSPYMNYCFMSCKHRALKYAAPRRHLPQTQRLIPKGRGSEKRPYDESPELHSKLPQILRGYGVSDGLRSSLTRFIRKRRLVKQSTLAVASSVLRHPYGCICTAV